MLKICDSVFCDQYLHLYTTNFGSRCKIGLAHMHCTAMVSWLCTYCPNIQSCSPGQPWSLFMHKISTDRSCVHYQSDPDTQMGSDSPSPWSFLHLALPTQRLLCLSWEKFSLNHCGRALLRSSFLSIFPILNTPPQAALPAAHLNTHENFSKFPENEPVHRASAQLSLQTGGKEI